MPALAPAAHFSMVFSDFLGSDEAIGAGAPSLAALQRRHLSSTGAAKLPALTVECESDPEGSDMLQAFSLRLKLDAQIGTEEGQITSEEAHEMLRACRDLLSDSPEAIATWDAWIEAQTEEYRTGWYIQSVWPGQIQGETNAEKNLLTLISEHTGMSFWNV